MPNQVRVRFPLRLRFPFVEFNVMFCGIGDNHRFVHFLEKLEESFGIRSGSNYVVSFQNSNRWVISLLGCENECLFVSKRGLDVDNHIRIVIDN